MASGTFTISPKPTWNGKEVMSLSEAILERSYQNPALNDIFTIYEGVKAKQQIVFLKNIFKISKKATTCGSGVSTIVNPTSEKFWDPTTISNWVSQCYTDFMNTFFVWSMKNGISREDLSDTDLERFKLEKLTDGAFEDLQRIIWFGDKLISDINASPAGTLTLSADIANYDQIDGIWKQIFDAVTAATLTRVTIAENALSPYATQLALAAGRAMTIFRTMYEQADSRLRSDPNKILLCTDELWFNWITSKESVAVPASFERQDKEFAQDVLRQMTIIPYSLWSRYIHADFNNTITSTYFRPHRSILTTKDNLAVGVDDQNELGSYEGYREFVTGLYHLRGGYMLDAKLLEEYRAIVAY